MALSKIPTDHFLAELGHARRSVKAFIPAIAGLHLFLLLLELAKKGVRVEIVLPASLLPKLDLKEAYFQNLQRAGGRAFLFPDDQLPLPGPRQFFALIDEEEVLYESALDPAALHRSRQETDYLRFQRLYDRLQPNCRAITAPPPPGDDPRDASPSASRRALRRSQLHIRLSADRPEALPDETFTLEWHVQGADRIWFNHGIGEVPGKGIKLVAIKQTTEFELTAENRQERQSRTLTVRISEAPRVEYRLTTTDPVTEEEIALTSRDDLPDHYAIIEGQVLRLSWRSFNAQSLEIDGIGPVELSGFRILVPEKLTAFTFQARGEKGTAVRTVVVNVFPIPRITQLYSAKPPEVEIRTSVEFSEPSIPLWLDIPENQDKLKAASALPDGARPERGIWGLLKRLFTGKGSSP